MTRFSQRRDTGQTGWTLVELLVAMTLSLLLIAGVGKIYLAAKRSYEIQTNMAQIQDVGRYVVNVLTNDIHQAGYWGLMDISRADSTPTIADNFILTGDPIIDAGAADGCPGTGPAGWGGMITHKVFGFDTDPSANNYSCITDWQPGTAVLTVRYADPVAVPQPTSNFTNTRLYLRAAAFQGSVVFGNPSDCPPGTAGCALVDNVNDPTFSDHALVAHTYYIATPIAAECGTVPVFARKTLTSNGTAQKESLVNGVEQMQFQFGVDTEINNDPASPGYLPYGDGSVNQYVDASQVADWNQVRAVRFWVLVRADCPESGYTNSTTYQLGSHAYPVNDQYRRALYTSTVSLRNG